MILGHEDGQRDVDTPPTPTPMKQENQEEKMLSEDADWIYRYPLLPPVRRRGLPQTFSILGLAYWVSIGPKGQRARITGSDLIQPQ